MYNDTCYGDHRDYYTKQIPDYLERLHQDAVNKLTNSHFNTKLVEDNIREILNVIEPRHIEEGLRKGLQDTPKRVAKMFLEVFSGYSQDPEEILTSASFDVMDDEASVYDELVIVKDIPFYSHCEHHMVPFFGKAHVGYIPNPARDGRVVGLSKLARVVDCFAKRLQVQERLTHQVAHAIETHLNALGVIVVIEAEHLCMCMRGVKKPGSSTTTSKVCGLLKTNGEARAEFLSLIGKSK